MNPITAALGKLDPANDNHWTQDGLPRLDTIKILAGDPTLTREQVTAAAPDFNRNAAQAAASGAPAGGATPVQGTPEAAALAAALAEPTGETNLPPAGVLDEPPLTPPALVEAVDDVETLRAQLDEALANLSDKTEQLSTAKQALEAAQNEVGVIENKLEKLSVSTAHPIAGYHARQLQVLEERAAKKMLIKESGLDLKELAKDLKSPLDSAMARKNSRGAARPVRS